jgi:hypothetical protein
MGKSSLLRALADRISFPIAFMNLQGMVNAKLEENIQRYFTAVAAMVLSPLQFGL